MGSNRESGDFQNKAYFTIDKRFCCLHSIHDYTLIHQLLELFQRIRFG